ncbi:hypothetical protein B0H14DRAFT_2565222 [Mycena olivaceomarginata]|nr:hypothetical protein B0H14DRAFT_2565222 [Mycena olivaceomarginata]
MCHIPGSMRVSRLQWRWGSAGANGKFCMTQPHSYRSIADPHCGLGLWCGWIPHQYTHAVPPRLYLRALCPRHRLPHRVEGEFRSTDKEKGGSDTNIWPAPGPNGEFSTNTRIWYQSWICPLTVRTPRNPLFSSGLRQGRETRGFSIWVHVFLRARRDQFEFGLNIECSLLLDHEFLRATQNLARDTLGTVCRLGPDIRSAARLVLWSRAFRWTQFLMTLTDFFGTELCVGFVMFSESLTESDSGARMVNTPGFCALLNQTWRLLCLFAFLEEAGNTVHSREDMVSAAGESLDALAAIVVGTISLIPPSTAKPMSLETYQLLHNVLFREEIRHLEPAAGRASTS